MKHLFFFTLVLIVFQAKAKHQKLKLQKALELKLVKVIVKSLGGHSNYCINMNIKNLTKDSLSIILEAGRRLNSIDDYNQDILITQEEMIVLKKLENKSLKVKGFCCQASHGSPRINSIYDVNKMADSSLVLLANYLNSNVLESSCIQNAVWAISDNHNTANISSNNDTTVLSLRHFISRLKREPIPWYTLISKDYVYNSGAFGSFNKLLKGKLKFNVENEGFTTLHILNSKGIEVCQIIEEWALIGDKVVDLNIPIVGLEKGIYTIEITNAEKTLIKKDFKI